MHQRIRVLPCYKGAGFVPVQGPPGQLPPWQHSSQGYGSVWFHTRLPSGVEYHEANAAWGRVEPSDKTQDFERQFRRRS